jgi:hypothetical protein
MSLVTVAFFDADTEPYDNDRSVTLTLSISTCPFWACLRIVESASVRVSLGGGTFENRAYPKKILAFLSMVGASKEHIDFFKRDLLGLRDEEPNKESKEEVDSSEHVEGIAMK